MATQRERDLARRLVSERMLTEGLTRVAFDVQDDLERQGRPMSFADILYARGWLKKGSVDAIFDSLPEPQSTEGHRPPSVVAPVLPHEPAVAVPVPPRSRHPLPSELDLPPEPDAIAEAEPPVEEERPKPQAPVPRRRRRR